ncbi:MAG: hypothetical protein NZ898_17375, partial [Myxococcota bacterium]|nr:hypothetical protein [Myxococcota bacterium]MDW8363419.1 hypothetical protein [Myxococcales bacterium]
MHGVQWFARDRAGSRGLADPKHPAVRGRARIFLALVAVGGFACASGDDPYGGTGRERRDGGASERDSGMLDARVEPPPRDAGGGTRDVGCVPERCNGVDDDCNGRADDGFACVGGTRESCRTASGAPGERTCEPDCSGWSPCRADEICNGMDDDGDGMVDDGFACARETSQPCTASTGARGVQACRADCSGWGPCAADEICNG